MSVEMHDAVNHIDMLMNCSGELDRSVDGYEKLDEMTGGLQGGDLFILAARPSMGEDGLRSTSVGIRRSITARRSRSSRWK